MKAPSTAWPCSWWATTCARAPRSTPCRSPKRSSSAASSRTDERPSVAPAGDRSAPGAAGRVAVSGVLERQTELLGDRRQPRQDVAHLVQLRLGVPLPDGLG